MEQLNNENVFDNNADNGPESISIHHEEDLNNLDIINYLRIAEHCSEPLGPLSFNALESLECAVIGTYIEDDSLVRKYCKNFKLFAKRNLDVKTVKGRRNRRVMLTSDPDPYMQMAQRIQWNSYYDEVSRREAFLNKDIVPQSVEDIWHSETVRKSYSDGQSSDIVPQSSSFNPFTLFTDPLGLKEVCSQLPSVVDAINNKLPDTQERKEFLDFFSSVGSKIPKLDFLKSDSKMLQSAFDIVGVLGKVHPSVLVAISASWYAHDRTWLSFAFFISSAVYFVLKVPEQLSYLLNIYLKMGDTIPLVPEMDMESVSPQMTDSNLESFGSIIAGALIGAVGITNKVSAGAFMLNFVKDFGRARLGMIEVAKLIIKLVEKAVNFVRETYLNMPSVRFIDTCSSEIDNFSKDVRNYSFKFNKNILKVDDTTYLNIVGFLEIGKALLKSIPRDKHSDASLRLIHEDCNSLKKIIIDMERSDLTLKGLRQETVAVLLSGGPGVAKSIAMLYGSHIVARDSLTEDEQKEFDINPGAYIFSRKQENVFFDTLTNRVRVFCYDDLFQAKDVAGSPVCEAMEIIRIINSEEYSAHMAHLENKGNVYVHPLYLFATTNQTTLKSNAIENNAALKRRFKLSYIVVPKDKYVLDEDKDNDIWNRRLDHSKLPKAEIHALTDPSLAGFVTTDLRPEHLDYYENNLLTGEIGNIISFEQLIAKARAAEFEKRKQFALHKQNFKTLVAKYAKVFETEMIDEVCPDDFSFDPSVDTQKDESDSEVEEFRGYLDCTEDEIQRLEYMLTVRPNYIYNMRMNFHPGEPCEVSDIVRLLVDQVGYYDAVDCMLEQRKFSTKFKFKKYKRPSLVIRAFVSVTRIVEYFLSLVPNWQTIKKAFTFDKDSLVTVLGFLAGSSILVFLAKWFYSWWTGKEVPQSFGFSDKMRTHKVNPKFVKNSQAVKNFLKVQPQFGEDTSGLDLVTSIVRKNCFRFEIMSDDDVWNCLGSITFVRGRIALIPYHFLVKLMQGVDVDPKRLTRHVRIGHGKEENDPSLLFTVEEILEGHYYGKLGINDLALVEFPKRMPERQDIVDKFALLRDMDFNTVNLDIVLPVIGRNRGFYFGKGRKYDDVIGITKFADFNYCIEQSYTYDIPTQPGDCGSLLCVLNPSLQKRKIFGIHVAGHDYRGDGFAGFVCQEYLLEDLKNCNPQVISEVPDLFSPQSSDLNKPFRFEILGRTDKVPSRNIFTDIRRSRMYGSLGKVIMAPALLRTIEDSGTLIDPLLNAQMKYCKPDVMFSMDVAKKCMAHYFSYCEWNSTYTVVPRIYTLDESIFGLEYDMDFGSVNSSTSAGWPSNVSGVRDLKKELFSYEYGSVEQDIVKDAISIKVNEIITKARNNTRMFHVFTDNLKDELRELHKVKSGSTRLFSGAPFEYLLAFRMYFGAFGLWFMKNRILNGSAIGVNPYSSEWNAIAKRLLRHGPDNLGAGDYEKYDGSQKALVHLLMLYHINKWYDDGPENAMIRSILWMEVYNSRHIVDGLIYEWIGGLGSGHPFTIIINTIYGHFNIRYCWYIAIGSLTLFDTNMYAIVQGDDLAYSVSDLFKDRFNDIVISERIKEVGMVYTNEAKDGTLVALRSLVNIEFLKRGFVFDESENLWIAPLRLQSILKMVDWTKRKHKNAIVASNVITAIKELALHDRETHDKYAPKIIKAFQKHYPFLTTHSPLIMDYACRKNEVLNTEGFY